MSTPPFRRIPLRGKQLGFIGAGNMSEAIVRGLLSSRSISPEQIIVSDVSDSRLQMFSNELKTKTTTENQDVLNAADLIILCIKPQMTLPVLSPLKFETRHVVVSILAGVPIEVLKNATGPNPKFVRVMPNTPMLCNEGACGIFAEPAVHKTEMGIVLAVFRTCSKVVIPLHNEDQINAVTAVSGSGPAYVFHLIEGMVEGGIKEGLTRDESTSLAIQTVIGAGKLAEEESKNGTTPAQLRERVTSPKGTTLAALEHMKSHNWKEVTTAAVSAAAHRGRELGEEQAEKLRAKL